MIRDKKLAVVMPAYNAARTLVTTYSEISSLGVVDTIVVVDDASDDETALIAATLPGVKFHQHPGNRGYGGNQKTCYRLALEADADIIAMVHPDYQYTPKLLPAMAELIASDLYDIVMGSRILGGGALAGGMPIWKYAANRFLTAFSNFLTGAKLSEYHSGYRAFSRHALESLALESYSDDFIFDNQLLMQSIWQGLRIGEMTCPTKYFPEASSINFRRSVWYGLGCLREAIICRLVKSKIIRPPWDRPRR
jgi:glycosyltransferase involved in cell wall biosynthesis